MRSHMPSSKGKTINGETALYPIWQKVVAPIQQYSTLNM